MQRLLPLALAATLATAALAGCAMLPNSGDVDAARAARDASSAPAAPVTPSVAPAAPSTTPAAPATPAPLTLDQRAWGNCVAYAQSMQDDLTFGAYASERVLAVPGQRRSIAVPVATIGGVTDSYASFTCSIDDSSSATVLSGGLSDAH
ncbi:hypothetical protein GCM10025867_50550 (plasmid) [Frondihabitans sucicola]|uniref:Uncharacterized protein n=1 Tax=Frondihabitans sucicola TaxID=1268041 RepID=A0ABN6Y673_9MICO|nr:hypothetical protein [Frondihabitans sucicola]BDZ52814.1 hypothetical protein GCM10025867_50550 [Frondihabitans sucicola]